MVANQPVPRPSTAFFACSQANHFFFPTSWKYWRLPTWLETLKYRYRKGLRATHSQSRNKPNKWNKNFKLHDVIKCGYKIQNQIFNCQISPGLAQPVNRVASTSAFVLKLFHVVMQIIFLLQDNAILPFFIQNH